MGWSEIPRYAFDVPEGWSETPVSIADLGGTEVSLWCTGCAGRLRVSFRVLDADLYSESGTSKNLPCFNVRRLQVTAIALKEQWPAPPLVALT